MLSAARRFDDLGVGEQPVPEPQPLEATVRALRPAEVGGEAVPPCEDGARDGTHG